MFLKITLVRLKEIPVDVVTGYDITWEDEGEASYYIIIRLSKSVGSGVVSATGRRRFRPADGSACGGHSFSRASPAAGTVFFFLFFVHPSQSVAEFKKRVSFPPKIRSRLFFQWKSTRGGSESVCLQDIDDQRR